MLMTRHPLFDTMMFPLFSERSAAWGRASFTPATDIHEHELGYTLRLDLPGLTEKEIELVVEGQHLTIKGERKLDENVAYTRQERGYGAFERLFHVPQDADSTQIDAKMVNGVLTINIPKRESAKARSISVKVG